MFPVIYLFRFATKQTTRPKWYIGNIQQPNGGTLLLVDTLVSVTVSVTVSIFICTLSDVTCFGNK